MLLSLRFTLYQFFQSLHNLRLRFIKFLKKVVQFALALCLRNLRLHIKIFYLRATSAYDGALMV